MTLNRSHDIGTWETCHAPWWSCFLKDQICFSFFGRRSFSDHFYQIILNNDHWFQRGLLSLYFDDKSRPVAPMLFQRIKFYLFTFVIGHIKTISAKSISILNTGFRGVGV